jgi:tRNA threonylcarbamoyl adenosine modification protein (Sua5/YciO/YrdC/YwlC family)
MKKIFIDPTNVDPALVKEAVRVISSGGIAALPTETVYGLAVSARNQNSIDKLYEIKRRPANQPFTLVVDGIDNAIRKFAILPPFAYRLMEKFWPGPLTIVYYCDGDEKIGIRVPSHIIAREILKGLPSGVYLPSANISGQKEAVSAQEVESIFDGQIDLIVDAGKTLYGRSSTVVDLTLRPFKILREGVVTEREIVDAFIRKRILFVCTGNSCRSPMAHYLLIKYLAEAKPYLKGVHEIISRGIATPPGLKVTANTVQLLKEKENIDIDVFKPKRLDRLIVLSSDLIFTMEDAQANYILNLEPTAEGRVFGLKKFLPQELENDIPDPIGQEYEFYERVYSIIKKAILELKDWL